MPFTPAFGAVVHVEYASSDPAATARFYAKMFGWKIETLPALAYTTFDAKDGVGGGFRPVEAGEPPQTVTYIAVPDVEKALADAKAAGATPALGKTEVPGMGWMAAVVVPGGPLQGFWQPHPDMT